MPPTKRHIWLTRPTALMSEAIWRHFDALGEDPIGRRSVVNLDSVESESVAVLVERIGLLSGGRMREICQALEVAVDCR